MIASWHHKGLRDFFETGTKKGIQPKHANRLRLQLAALNKAKAAGDMAVPSWHLHPLEASLPGVFRCGSPETGVSRSSSRAKTRPSSITRTTTRAIGSSSQWSGTLMRMHNPPHPGLLVREWMNGRTVTAVADHLGVSRIALSNILNGKAGVSAEMAIRLSQVFGTSADLWVGLQSQYDLWQARKKRIKTKPLVAA